MKRIVLWGVVALLIAVAAVSGWKILSTEQAYRQGKETYQETAQKFTGKRKTKETATPILTPEPGTKAAEEKAARDQAWENQIVPPIQVNFGGLQEMNPDVVGWIYSEGTAINYPVLQGDDNGYYLKHLVDGSYNADGSIFVDANNQTGFADGNTIIYGHNMKDGMMFAELLNYADQAYYEAHPVIWLLTPKRNYQIVLFAGYTTDGNSDTYTIFDSTSDALYTYGEERIQKSDFQTDVRPQKGDRLVVLSTCAYSKENARYAVHGILRPCGPPIKE